MVSRFKEESPKQRTSSGGFNFAAYRPGDSGQRYHGDSSLIVPGNFPFGMNRTPVCFSHRGGSYSDGRSDSDSGFISIFGRNLLWPAKLQADKKTRPGFWQRLGGQITRRPVVFIIPIIVCWRYLISTQ